MDIIKKIKQILIKIGQIQAVILMGVIYYLIIGPMAIIYQLFKKKEKKKNSYWIKKEKITDMETYLKRQF